MSEVPREEVVLFNKIILAIQKLYIACMIPIQAFNQFGLTLQILAVLMNPEEKPTHADDPPSPR